MNKPQLTAKGTGGSESLCYRNKVFHSPDCSHLYSLHRQSSEMAGTYLSHTSKTKLKEGAALTYFPPPLLSAGAGLVSKSEIWDDNLVFAAVCCCTLTSAASAKCINVFRSGLSSKFLQPMHLHMEEHMIFAWKKQTKYKKPVASLTPLMRNHHKKEILV